MSTTTAVAPKKEKEEEEAEIIDYGYELRAAKIRKIKLQKEKQRRLGKDNFYNFFRMSWSVIWPKIPFKDNWHYEILCNELQEQIERINKGEPKPYDIIINVPFRTAKSTIMSICLVAWTWINYPHIKFIFGSHIEKLSLDHSVRCRKLIKSAWYQSTFRPKWILSDVQDAKGHFENTEGGYRISTSVGGSIGFGADFFGVDDPISREDALSDPKRLTANEWLKETVPTRLNDPEVSMICLLMQRLHEEDPTGDTLTREKKLWKHFCFPSDDEYEIKPVKYKQCYIKGVMFPTRHPKSLLAKFKKKLGSFTYASQMGQSPVPPEGNLFKNHWWNYWKPDGMNLPRITYKLSDGKLYTPKVISLPKEFDETVISADMTFKGTEGTDRVSFQYWAGLDTRKFLLDQILGQMDFIETLMNAKVMYKSHKDADAFLVEDKANGPAAMSALERKIDILIPVEPLGSKTSRVLDSSKAMSMVAQCEGGRLYLPHPALAIAICKDDDDNTHNWVDEFIKEYAIFPRGKHDDQVDAGSQAIQRLTSSGDFGLYTTSQYEEEREDIENDLDEEIRRVYTNDGS